MKKVLRGVLTTALLALAVVALTAAPSQAGIENSSHDLSGTFPAATDQLCIYCHTPHGGSASVTDAPLWNHLVTSQTFTVYTSPTSTLNATVGQPSGISQLCLSCHDGVTALDAFGGTTIGTAMATTASGYVGTDLSNDHPISLTYDNALATADGQLFDPDTVKTTGGLRLYGSGGYQLECGSCHDVHNNSGQAKMLRKSNASSALCLTCHNK